MLGKPLDADVIARAGGATPDSVDGWLLEIADTGTAYTFDPGTGPLPVINALVDAASDPIAPRGGLIMTAEDDFAPDLVLLEKQLAQVNAAVVAGVTAAMLAVPPVDAFDAIRSASKRPVDLVFIGNSKMLWQGNEGVHYGVTRGLAEEFGLWASPFYPVQVTNTGIAQQGDTMRAINNAGTGTAISTMPSSAYDNFQHPQVPGSYVASGGIGDNAKYIAIGTTAEGSLRSHLNVNSALRYTLTLAGFAPGAGGTVQPSARKGSDGGSGSVASGNPLANDSGVAQLVYQGLMAPAAVRDSTLQFGIDTSAGPSDAGPNVFFMHRVDDTARTMGVSTHVMFGLSGNDLRTISNTVAATAFDRNANYLSLIRDMHIQRGHAPRIVLVIQEGLNSRNDASGSVGPVGGIAGNTGPGYVDNAKALYNYFINLWQAKGWDRSELTFLWLIDEYSQAAEPLLDGFAAAMKGWAGSMRGHNVVALNDLITWTQMNSLGVVGSDAVHKIKAFYTEAYARRLVNHVMGREVAA